MSVRVHLVRHGAHGDLGQRLSGRSPGGQLSREGRSQVRRVAEVLAREDISAIQASPRLRTQETARIIARPFCLEVETVAALDELDFGNWTGRTFTELAGDSLWRHWNASRSTCRPPGGETMRAAVDRVIAHLADLDASQSGLTILCVSHGDIIRGTLAHYLGLSLDNILRFDVEPASVSTLTIGSWGGRVERMNEVRA